MQITYTITLTLDEESEIAGILGCTNAELNSRLNACFGASLKEYLTMFRGQKVFKRGSDILEYRLFLLIESTFNGVIPDERIVSSLFQTTLSESRSLIRAVVSKYQYQLRKYIDATITALLIAATRKDVTHKYSVVINNQNMVNELNKVLGVINGSLSPVAKKKGSVSTYEIEASSYNELCDRFKVQGKP